MTTAKSLKQRIRARMADTGERYTTARMHVLGAHLPAVDIPHRPPGYELIGGGSHPDTACVHNALLAAGIVAPHDGEPYSDALLYGLGGGTGFLYAVFEYRGFDPMLSIGVRHTMMGHDFAREALRRGGIRFDLIQTASPDKADRVIDEALADGVAPIVTVDDPSLPYSGLPEWYCGGSAQQVAVVGADVDHVWLDDRELMRIPRPAFRRARGAYKKPRHHTMVVRGGGTSDDLRAGVLEAIRANVTNFEESPYKGFASNWGFAGMDKWARLMRSSNDPKRWARIFPTDRLAFTALNRIRESIEWTYTPPAAGRGIYADFLDEAAEIVGAPALGDVAGRYRTLAEAWRDLGALATSGHPAFVRHEELGERSRRSLGDLGGEAGPARRAVFDERVALADEASFEDGFVDQRLGDLANRLEEIIELEREAAGLLAGAV